MMDDNKQEKTVGTGLLVKSSLWYTIANFVTRAIVFLINPVFARILSHAEYGDFTVFASWQAILIIVCGLEVYNTINRARFDFKTTDEFNAYISSSLVVSTLITAVFFAAYMIFPGFFYRIFLLPQRYMIVMFIYLFTFPAFSMFQAKQRIEYKYKLNATIAFLIALVSSVMSVALAVILTDDRLLGRVIGQYMPYAVAGVVFYIVFLRKSVKINVRAVRYAVRIGLPLVFGFLGSQILLTSDGLILKHMCTDAEVSYVSVTHTCANIVILLVQTLNNAWAPWFYDKLNIKEYGSIKKVFNIYMIVILVITFGVVFLGPEVVLILGGSKYKVAEEILPVIVTCGVFTALTSQFTNLETFYKKPEYAAILTAIAAILNIGLDIVGVRIWGYQAVCYVTVLCQIILVIMHYAVSYKLGVAKTLAFKNMLAIILAALCVIPLSFVLYKNNIVRYSIIGVLIVAMLIVAVLKRRQLLEILRKILKKEKRG